MWPLSLHAETLSKWQQSLTTAPANRAGFAACCTEPEHPSAADCIAAAVVGLLRAIYLSFSSPEVAANTCTAKCTSSWSGTHHTTSAALRTTSSALSRLFHACRYSYASAVHCSVDVDQKVFAIRLWFNHQLWFKQLHRAAQRHHSSSCLHVFVTLCTWRCNDMRCRRLRLAMICRCCLIFPWPGRCLCWLPVPDIAI